MFREAKRALRFAAPAVALSLLTTVAMVGTGAEPGFAEPSATNDNSSTSSVEDYTYPGAAKFAADYHVRLLSGDGNIVAADCGGTAAAAGLIAIRTGADANGQVCFRVLRMPGNISMEVPAVTDIRGDGHDIVALFKPAGAAPAVVHVNSSATTAVGIATTTQLQLNAAEPSSPAKPTIRWPQWDVNDLPNRGGFDDTNWSQIPRWLDGEEERAWSCQMGAELHHGGPRSQALAASTLLQPSGHPDDVAADWEAARDMDTADYPLGNAKRAPQEAAWKAQLAPLPGADVIPPSFGYPSDSFLWEHINFDRISDVVPMASDATITKVHDMVVEKVKTDPFLKAYAAYMDDVFVANGAEPGWGDRATPEALKQISADDARRFLLYGGFPMVAPVKGTPQFRVEVESVKARWASCDITNPQDPYGVLTEVVATAQAEWNAERDAQADDRKTIVEAHTHAWNAMRLANENMVESVGQAWVAERALTWQKNRLSSGKPLTNSEQTALNGVLMAAQARITQQINLADQNVAAAASWRDSAVDAQGDANARATAAGYPLGRGLTYAHQSVQVTKALVGAATAAADAAKTALQATKTTGATSDALWAQSQAEMHAVQAKFRRQAAEYAQYEAHAAAGAAAAEAQKANAAADQAHDDRVKAEAAEAIAKDKAADAHAKMLAAKTERDNAAAKHAEADRQRGNAAAAQARAQQQRDVAVAKRNAAQSQADVASRKRQDAEAAERHASNERNIAINAALSGRVLEQRAAAAEATAAAADSDDDAGEARAAATEARTAAKAATAAASQAQAAADEATTAAVAARKAATEAKAAADRADADADAAEADAADTAAQLRTAQAAAADAIYASKDAAAAVTAAQQQAATAAAKAQEARDQADQARVQANLSLGASADALGRATAAADQAAATRDAALRTYAAADDTVAMGTPFAQTDTSAGMAVLVGQNAKTIAEQQSAAADAKAAEAARAAQAAHDAAAQANADAKAAAEAAAAAADDASAAQRSVKDAAAAATRAAKEASAAAASVARTAQYNANAQSDAATAARYAAEANNEAQAAWDAADEAERDAVAAHAAADQASSAAADARAAAAQAEKDAAAAEAAAERALQDAHDAQEAATQAEQNADANARAELAVNSPTGEPGVQALPHITDEIIGQTPIQCPPLTGSRFCETTVVHHITGTIDMVLVTCPDLNDTYCPGDAVTDQITTISVDTKHEQQVQLDRSDVLNILQHVAEALISDYITCAKGVTVTDGKIDGGQAKEWGKACAWVAADLVLPAAAGATVRGVKAVRIAMRTGVGIGEAYEALRGTEISAAALTKLEDDVFRALESTCLRKSFAAGTLVLLDDRTTKPIEQVVKGDHVLGLDVDSRKGAVGTVTDWFVNRDIDLADVTVRDAAGKTTVLHTTQHHPFWVEGAVPGWLDAGTLEPGDILHTASGDKAVVEAVQSFTGAQDMYDLTVEGLHNFYVSTGSAAVLVHNAGCWVDLSGPGIWSRVVESMSARAAAYQARITGVPHGMGYVLKGVKFDGYRAGILLDAKGPGYATFVKDGRFVPWYDGAGGLADQARRQLVAASGAKIEWHVAEPEAATAIGNLFADRGISGISIVVAP